MCILSQNEAKEGAGEILLKNKKRDNGRETLEQKLLWNEMEAIYLGVSGVRGLSRIKFKQMAESRARLSVQQRQNKYGKRWEKVKKGRQKIFAHVHFWFTLYYSV